MRRTSSIPSGTRRGAPPSPTRRRRCATSSSRTRSTGWRSIRFDGLRLDAIDQIDDQSETPILEELAADGAPHASPTGTSISRPRTTATSCACTSATRTAGRASTTANGTTTSITPRMSIATGERRSAITPTMRPMPASISRGRWPSGYVYQGEPSPYRDGAPARRAERASCRRRPSSTSCRTTTRSATAPSASG